MPKVLHTYSIAEALIFTLVLILVLAHFYINAQVAALQVERGGIERQISDLNVLKGKLKELRGQIKNTTSGLSLEVEIYSLTGSLPYSIEPIFNDTSAHIYVFLNTNCPPCEEDYRQQFNFRVKNWVSETVNIEGEFVNIAKGFTIADKIYREINSSKPKINTAEIIILYGDLVLKASWGLSDEAIVKAVEKLVKLKEAPRDLEVTIPEIPELKHTSKVQLIENPVAAFMVGAVQGFNPCIVAIMTFIVATVGGKGRFIKLTAIALGVLYSYLIFSFIAFSSPVIIQNIQYATTALIIVLIVLILYYLVELALEIKAEGVGMDASRGVLPLFKTPKLLLKLASKVVSSENLYLYFTLGLVFSLIKMPCIAPLTTYYIAKLPYQPTQSLMNIVSLNIGTVAPFIVLAALVCMGILTVEKIASMRGLKVRILQRTVVIAALALTVLLLLIIK